MEIIVTGKQLSVGDALRSHIEERMEQAVAKYLDKVNAFTVVLSKEGHAFRVDITGNLGTHSHVTLQSRDEGTDPYGAFDSAADKIEKQLRRYKRQLKNHHNPALTDEAMLERLPAAQYVISAEEEHESQEAPDNPLIIAEKSTHIEHLTVSDAVMRMDLGDLPALVFVNSANDRLNMIYRRNDGNIAWVDPTSEAVSGKNVAA